MTASNDRSRMLARNVIGRLEVVPTAVLAWAVFVLTLLLYLLASTPLLPHHPDPLTNTFTAWSIANQQTVYLNDWELVTGEGFYGATNQIIRGRGRPISKYPPGTALIAAPLYTVFDSTHPVAVPVSGLEGPPQFSSMPLPQLWPSVFTAALVTAMASTFFFRLVARWTDLRFALLGWLAFAFGTSLWSLAANALWQHGPTALAIVSSHLLMDRKRKWAAGTALGSVCFLRPQLAIAVLAYGILLTVRRRSFSDLFAIGVPAAAWASLYVAFNLTVFGDVLPIDAGGYALDTNLNASNRAGALWGGLTSLKHGLLVYSPVVAIGVVAIFDRLRYRRLPDWTVVAAVAGIPFFLFQVRAGDFAGGDGFLSYRYPIESVVLAAPALFLAIVAWSTTRVRQILSVGTATWGVVLHAVVVIVT